MLPGKPLMFGKATEIEAGNFDGSVSRTTPQTPRTGAAIDISAKTKPAGWDAADTAGRLALLGITASFPGITAAGDQDDLQRLEWEDPASGDCDVVPEPNGILREIAGAVQQRWTGMIEWAPGIYEMTSEWDDVRGGFTLDCPDSFHDDDKTTRAVAVLLFSFEGVKGPDSVERIDEIARYSVTFVPPPPTGEPALEFVWTSPFRSAPHVTPDPVWEGPLALNTTVECRAKVAIPVTGVRAPTFPRRKSTTVTPRTGAKWRIEPPPSAAEDVLDIWPANYKFYECGSPDQKLGANVDATTFSTLFIFSPNPHGRGWDAGYDRRQIASGPHEGLWYVAETRFEIDRGTLINKHLKASGPPPVQGALNWFQANGLPDASGNACFPPRALYLQAIRAHENLGAYPAANGAGAGHYAQLLKGEADLPDLAEAIEAAWAGTDSELRGDVEGLIGVTEGVLSILAENHTYVGGNFSHLLGSSSFIPLLFVPEHKEQCWDGATWEPCGSNWQRRDP